MKVKIFWQDKDTQSSQWSNQLEVKNEDFRIKELKEKKMKIKFYYWNKNNSSLFFTKLCVPLYPSLPIPQSTSTCPMIYWEYQPQQFSSELLSMIFPLPIILNLISSSLIVYSKSLLFALCRCYSSVKSSMNFVNTRDFHRKLLPLGS